MEDSLPPKVGVLGSEKKGIYTVFSCRKRLRQYVTNGEMLTDMAGVVLRPWHLSWKADAGFRGYSDPAMSPVNCAVTSESHGPTIM